MDLPDGRARDRRQLAQRQHARGARGGRFAVPDGGQRAVLRRRGRRVSAANAGPPGARRVGADPRHLVSAVAADLGLSGALPLRLPVDRERAGAGRRHAPVDPAHQPAARRRGRRGGAAHRRGDQRLDDAVAGGAGRSGPLRCVLLQPRALPRDRAGHAVDDLRGHDPRAEERQPTAGIGADRAPADGDDRRADRPAQPPVLRRSDRPRTATCTAATARRCRSCSSTSTSSRASTTRSATRPATGRCARSRRSSSGKIRDADYVFRWGGDEFLLLLSCREDEALRRGLDLQSEFRATAAATLPKGVGLSFGCAEVSPLAESANDALKMADERMYANKRAARVADAKAVRKERASRRSKLQIQSPRFTGLNPEPLRTSRPLETLEFGLGLLGAH